MKPRARRRERKWPFRRTGGDRVRLGLVLCLSCTLAAVPAWAGAPSARAFADGTVGLPLHPVVNDADTSELVLGIEDASRVCRAVSEPYKPDCFARRLSVAVRSFQGGSDYDPARRAIRRLVQDIDRIVAENRDRQQPRIRVRAPNRPGRTVTLGPLTPVRRDRVAPAERAIRARVAETQATLLRSVPKGDPRQIHYQRIAEAFDGAAVLLRS